MTWWKGQIAARKPAGARGSGLTRASAAAAMGVGRAANLAGKKKTSRSVQRRSGKLHSHLRHSLIAFVHTHRRRRRLGYLKRKRSSRHGRHVWVHTRGGRRL